MGLIGGFVTSIFVFGCLLYINPTITWPLVLAVPTSAFLGNWLFGLLSDIRDGLD